MIICICFEYLYIYTYVCMLLLFSAKSYLTLYDLMDCSMPVFPVLHYLLELPETHVH